MEIVKLNESLNKQIDNLKALFETASRKQKALIARNNEQLLDCISKEERILLNINEEEKNRLKIISDIYRESSLTPVNTKIASFIKAFESELSDVQIKKLTESELMIREVTASIGQLNFQNMYLIAQAKSFISQTIQILRSTASKSILDRKI